MASTLLSVVVFVFDLFAFALVVPPSKGELFHPLIPMASTLLSVVVFVFDLFAFALVVAAKQRRAFVRFIGRLDYQKGIDIHLSTTLDLLQDDGS
ncbi:hypothetical protein L6452_18899 [Arctium lappa]|uniref:Uncharacterized protein n=1 Tax=Arctium lappa TaxID=4217 RepID=A0ACB9B8Z0_ARCLA|nr:hypothetical protein L6452_18899 [Arctium lappa]